MFTRFLLPVFALACLGLQSCMTLPPFLFGANRGKVRVEKVEPAERFWTASEILLIPLSGMVDTGSEKTFAGDPGMLVALKDRLKAAEDNPRIKAVVLRINSPGGGVTSADLIYREILRFKEKTKIPVIAEMTDMAASGGLYIAMGADEIYALPTTITGSIGVITMLPGIKGLSDKIGFEMRIIDSGKYKDAGSPFREMKPEERQIFQNLIDKFYQHFLQVILTSRQSKGLTAEKLKPLADGRILDAEAARQGGLIDGIKYPNEVIERAKELAQVKDAAVISYEYPFAYRGNIYARQDAPEPRAAMGDRAGDINLLKLDLGGMDALAQGPKFMYLCLP
jgi:protease IV